MDPLNLLGRLRYLRDDDVDDDDGLPSQRSTRAVSPHLPPPPRPCDADRGLRGSVVPQHTPWKQKLDELRHFATELAQSTSLWAEEQQQQQQQQEAGQRAAAAATGIREEPPRKRARGQWPDSPYYGHPRRHDYRYGCQRRFPKLSQDDEDFYRYVHDVLDDIERRVPPAVLLSGAANEPGGRALFENELEGEGEEEAADGEKDLSRHSSADLDVECMSENEHPNRRMDRHMAGAGFPSMSSDAARTVSYRRQAQKDAKAFIGAFASSVAPGLAECLVALLIHLPAVVVEHEQNGPFATPYSSVDYGYMQAKAAAGRALQLSVSLQRRAGELWLHLFHQHGPFPTPSSPTEGGAPLISPAQWRLLAERVAEGSAPAASSRRAAVVSSSMSAAAAAAAPPPPATPMACLATWLRILLSTWKAAVVPEISTYMRAAAAQPRHDGPAIRSVRWWLWLLESTLPAARLSYADLNWMDELQRLVDSVPDDEAPPEPTRDGGPHSRFCSETVEVAVAIQALTARAMEVVAALAAVAAASHDLPAADHPSSLSQRLVEAYATDTVSHALHIHSEASAFLHYVEEEKRVEEARIAALKKERLFFSDINGPSNHDLQLEDLEPPNWPPSYLNVVAFVVDRLDAAFRTSKAAAGMVQALRGQARVEDDTESQQRLAWEHYLPLWKAATTLAVTTPMSDTHGRLVTDIAFEVLSSLSAMEVGSTLAAIESLNLTVMRACEDNPRWLFESGVLAVDGVEDDGASSSSVEAALQSLSSASAEVRHGLLLAALQLSDVDRAAHGSSASRRRTAEAHSREAHARLWGLVLRGRDGTSEEAKADVWTDYLIRQAKQRGLLEGFQI